jgi:hypothetical protein
MGLNKTTVQQAHEGRQSLQLLLITNHVAALCVTCGCRADRPHDHGPDMVLLPSGAAAIRLSRGKDALVDPVDANRVMAAGPWTAMWNGKLWYAISSSAGYLHRFILGVDDAVLVDHENRNTLDCRRENLRRATHSQNTCNHLKKRYPSGTSSAYKGVDLHGGRWRAQIAKDGVRRHLGLFDSERDAALAYDAAARNLHGEFARLNFPQSGENTAIDIPALAELKRMPEGHWPAVDGRITAAVTASSRRRRL